MEGNLGFSLRKQRPAVELVLEAYPTTLKLAGVTLLIGISLAVVVGALAAYRPGGLFDRMGSTFALVGASAPDFWVAITAILFFSVSLQLVAHLRHRWFPVLDHAGDGARTASVWIAGASHAWGHA